MDRQLRIRKVGNGYGFSLPKDILRYYHLKEGSVIRIVTHSEGITLYTSDEALEDWERNGEKAIASLRSLMKKTERDD